MFYGNVRLESLSNWKYPLSQWILEQLWKCTPCQFSGSSLNRQISLKPKIQKQHHFADPTLNYLCLPPNKTFLETWIRQCRPLSWGGWWGCSAWAPPWCCPGSSPSPAAATPLPGTSAPADMWIWKVILKCRRFLEIRKAIPLLYKLSKFCIPGFYMYRFSIMRETYF